jgi:hypothetical protein
MANLIYRTSLTPTVPSSSSVKSSGLFNSEIDGNFKSLDESKLELSDAVSTNTPDTVVKRDSSGNFTAGTITAALSGNATTASTLQTGRTITIGSTGKSFDGSGNVSWTLSEIGAAPQADVTSNNTPNTIVGRDGSGDFTAGTITAALSGNASTATTLQTSRTIWGQSFNGGSDVTGGISGITTLSMSNQLTNTIASGTAPFVITSTTRVANLNVAVAGTADQLTSAVNINGTSFDGSSGITITANTPNTLTRGTYLTGNNFNGSAATTWDVDATSTSTASKIVARDESGNFAANVVTVTDLNSTSDRNAKDNIQTIESTMDTLNQIRGTSFNWKSDGRKSYGVIAQELQQVLPELVTETSAGLSVAYVPLIAFLIEAVKQQELRITELETYINNK